VLRNLPSRPIAWLLGMLVFPLGRSELGPSDELGSRVARRLQHDDRAREALTAGIFVPPASEAGLGQLDAAFDAARSAQPIEAQLRKWLREGKLDEPTEGSLARAAFDAGMITESDYGRISAADGARERAIQVDAFDPDEFRSLRR